MKTFISTFVIQGFFFYEFRSYRQISQVLDTDLSLATIFFKKKKKCAHLGGAHVCRRLWKPAEVIWLCQATSTWRLPTVGAGSWTRVVCKSSNCSYPVSHLSSLEIVFLLKIYLQTHQSGLKRKTQSSKLRNKWVSGEPGEMAELWGKPAAGRVPSLLPNTHRGRLSTIATSSKRSGALIWASTRVPCAHRYTCIYK